MKDPFPRALFFLLCAGALLAQAGDSLSDASRKLMVVACKYPYRKIDGKTEKLAPVFEFIQSDAQKGQRRVPEGWRMIHGKISQVTANDGIIVLWDESASYTSGDWRFRKLDEPKRIRVEHFPNEDLVVDDSFFIGFAKQKGRFRYKTVSGSVATIESYDFGPEQTPKP